MITSWTNGNPGRRYAICSQEVGGCGYWDWIDEEKCCYFVELIPGKEKIPTIAAMAVSVQ